MIFVSIENSDFTCLMTEFKEIKKSCLNTLFDEKKNINNSDKNK
jgi:hypothetical protein